jgi:hypothetical protein
LKAGGQINRLKLTVEKTEGWKYYFIIIIIIIIIIYCNWVAPGGSSLTPLHTINTI